MSDREYCQHDVTKGWCGACYAELEGQLQRATKAWHETIQAKRELELEFEKLLNIRQRETTPADSDLRERLCNVITILSEKRDKAEETHEPEASALMYAVELLTQLLSPDPYEKAGKR